MKYTNIRLHRISAVLLVLLTLLLPFAPMASGETENPLYQIVNCEEWISLRAEASSSSKRLEKIPLWGIVIGMGETKNGFTKVKYHDVGYVQTKYLQPQCASLVQVDNTEKVPVYESDGSVLDTIMYWDSVYYLGEYQNNFLAVSWENSSGRVGYVAIDAVMSSKHTKDEALSYVLDVDSNIALYVLPIDSSDKIGEVPPNSVVALYGAAGNGMSYVYYGGQYGYVLSKYLTDAVTCQ